MRINSENKTMDIEARDINYILPAYVRSYQFHSKNEVPTKIIFPMFVSVRAAGIDIPIEWVPPLEQVATEIAKDGSNVAEVTEEQEVVLDEKDTEIKRLKDELAQTGRGGEEGGGDKPTSEVITSEQLKDEAADKELEEETEPEAESPAKAAFNVDPDPSHQPPPDRIPKTAPGGDIGAGQPLSDTHPRDRKDQTRTAKDLQVEPEIEGAPEKEFGKDVKRGEDGRPIVEEKPE